MKFRHAIFFIGAMTLSAWSFASDSNDAAGLWMTAQSDAIIEFKPCGDGASALCGRIVWDKDAGASSDTCGVQVAQLNRYADGAWRDGWVYDPRDRKKYKGVVRVKSGDLYIRAFVGVEVLGQTEQLTHVSALPTTPVCKE